MWVSIFFDARMTQLKWTITTHLIYTLAHKYLSSPNVFGCNERKLSQKHVIVTACIFRDSHKMYISKNYCKYQWICLEILIWKVTGFMLYSFTCPKKNMYGLQTDNIEVRNINNNINNNTLLQSKNRFEKLTGKLLVQEKSC